MMCKIYLSLHAWVYVLNSSTIVRLSLTAVVHVGHLTLSRSCRVRSVPWRGIYSSWYAHTLMYQEFSFCSISMLALTVPLRRLEMTGYAMVELLHAPQVSTWTIRRMWATDHVLVGVRRSRLWLISEAHSLMTHHCCRCRRRRYSGIMPPLMVMRH
jgi:hypothetical protein